MGFLRWDPETWEIGGSETELGWGLAREHWGRGYATEAARALRDWAFGERGLTRLISLIQPEQPPSIRVAEKLGERHERDVEVRGLPTRLYSIEPMTELRPLAGTSVVDVTVLARGADGDAAARRARRRRRQGRAARRRPRPRLGAAFVDGGGGAMFFASNAGKRSLAVDLGNDSGREIVLRLADRADVFVQSLRPGAAERHGLGAVELRARNPRLVYCSIGAFGVTRPAERPAGLRPSAAGRLGDHERDRRGRTGRRYAWACR